MNYRGNRCSEGHFVYKKNNFTLSTKGFWPLARNVQLKNVAGKPGEIIEAGKKIWLPDPEGN